MTDRPNFVLVLATALALSACSAAPADSPSAAQPTAVSQTPIPTVAAARCPYPDGDQCRGPLAAGVSYTSQLFVPALSLVVGEGWDNTVDNPNEYQLMRRGPDGQPSQSGIYMFRNVAIQAATCEDKPEPGIGGTPAEMAAYLSNHPGLTTTEPEAVNVGGLDGVVIEVALAPTWTEPCHYSEGQPNVPLFWGADADSGLEWSMAPGWQSRFYILAMPGGGNVLIDMGAFGEGDFDAFREAAVPVIDSITFDQDYY
ncbi:MAG: hypothetical protein ABIQ05_03840 [Candidatus Limnocylindria bacterium]